VAVTNLAFGVLRLLCTRLRGPFWLATAIGQAIFLWGASAVHAREMLKERNFNRGNVGPIFSFDVLVPLVHLGLLGGTQVEAPEELGVEGHDNRGEAHQNRSDRW
jgi:hypothetical protein